MNSNSQELEAYLINRKRESFEDCVGSKFGRLDEQKNNNNKIIRIHQQSSNNNAY